jgi:uncharacterized protein DUF4240
MTKDGFWKLIDKSRRGAENVDAQMARLLELLTQSEPKEILSFDRRFQECIRDAYCEELWAAAYIINGGCSDDGFDYFLGWLVAQGRRFFEATLADPEKAGRRVEPGEEVECAEIWSVAARAYEAKTGKQDFYDVVPGVTRRLRGRAWDEETVGQIYPRLAKRFGM